MQHTGYASRRTPGRDAAPGVSVSARQFWQLRCSTASAFFAKALAPDTMADNPPCNTRDMPPGASLGATPRRACPCRRDGFGNHCVRPPQPFSQRLWHRALMPITRHAKHGTCLQAHAWARRRAGRVRVGAAVLATTVLDRLSPFRKGPGTGHKCSSSTMQHTGYASRRQIGRAHV